jgi:hypothetical protein
MVGLTTKLLAAIACALVALIAIGASPAAAASTRQQRPLVASAAGAPGPCSAAALRVMSQKRAYVWCKKYGDGLPRWLLPALKQRVTWKGVCRTAGIALFFAPEIKGILGLAGTFASRFDNLVRIPGFAQAFFC